MTINSLPHGTIGVDFASRVDIGALRSAGAKFACRYLSIERDSWKTITPRERDDLWDAGIGILLNWEAGQTPWTTGSGAGTNHGEQAAAQARTLGYPASLPIIASIDTAVTADQLRPAAQYLEDFAQAIGDYPLGVYGGAPIANTIGDLASFIWAADATGWGTDFHRPPDLQQRLAKNYPAFANLAVDVDIAMTTIDVWAANGSAPPPVSHATYTVQRGDTMSGIAERHGISLIELEDLNPQIADPSLIRPGEVLDLP